LLQQPVRHRLLQTCVADFNFERTGHLTTVINVGLGSGNKSARELASLTADKHGFFVIAYFDIQDIVITPYRSVGQRRGVVILEIPHCVTHGVGQGEGVFFCEFDCVFFTSAS